MFCISKQNFIPLKLNHVSVQTQRGPFINFWILWAWILKFTSVCFIVPVIIFWNCTYIRELISKQLMTFFFFDCESHLKPVRDDPELLLTVRVPNNFHSRLKLQFFIISHEYLQRGLWECLPRDVPTSDSVDVVQTQKQISIRVHSRGCRLASLRAHNTKSARVCIFVAWPRCTVA